MMGSDGLSGVIVSEHYSVSRERRVPEPGSNTAKLLCLVPKQFVDAGLQR